MWLTWGTIIVPISSFLLCRRNADSAPRDTPSFGSVLMTGNGMLTTFTGSANVSFVSGEGRYCRGTE